MVKLLQKVKQLESERQDVRRDIKKLQERLGRLTRSSPPSNEHESFCSYNEDPQTNVEIEKWNDQHFAGYLSSRLPRFMRPTICSRKKYGVDLPNMESRLRKGQTHTRVRRASSLPADSITFPVKGISEYGSDYSISRTSCLVGSKMKCSEDYETEFSHEATECHIKSVASLDDERSERTLACSKSYVSHESSWGNGKKKEDKFDSYKENNWFRQQKKKSTNRSYTSQKNKVLACPPPKHKNSSNGTDEAEVLHNEDVHNYEFTRKRLFGDDKIKKQGQAGIAEQSITEVAITKTETMYDNIIAGCGFKHISRDGKVVEETENVFNDFRIKDNSCSLVHPPNVGCDGLEQKEDYDLFTRVSDKIDETQILLESFGIADNGRNPLSPHDSDHHVSTSELESESQSWPTETLNEDAILPNKIEASQQKIQRTLVSDNDNSSEEERNNGYLYVSPQYLVDLNESCLQAIGSRRDDVLNLKDANQEDVTISFIQCQENIQRKGNKLKPKKHRGINNTL